MPRYADDATGSLSQGIESLGGSIASIITAKKGERQRKETGGIVARALDDATTPDETGKPKLDLRNPLALGQWLRTSGAWDKLIETGQLGQALGMINAFVPGEDGETWQPVSADMAAKAFGGDPADFRGGGWEFNVRSGQIRQVTRPQGTPQPKEPTAPTTRAVDVGDRVVTYQWDPASGRWIELASAPRWQPPQPDKPEKAPEQFDVLTAAEKAAIEEAAGMPAGSLSGAAVQRSRVTGRLHNLPAQLDALYRALAGGLAPAAAPAPATPSGKGKPSSRFDKFD